MASRTPVRRLFFTPMRSSTAGLHCWCCRAADSMVKEAHCCGARAIPMRRTSLSAPHSLPRCGARASANGFLPKILTAPRQNRCWARGSTPCRLSPTKLCGPTGRWNRAGNKATREQKRIGYRGTASNCRPGSCSALSQSDRCRCFCSGGNAQQHHGAKPVALLRPACARRR